MIVNPKQNHSGDEVAIRGILKPKIKRKGNQLVDVECSKHINFNDVKSRKMMKNLNDVKSRKMMKNLKTRQLQ